MKPESFKGSEPRLVFDEFFSGKTKAFGILFGRSGEVKRQFTVDMLGSWEGDIFTLRENFVFSDGETMQRVWSVKKINENSYEGTASDVVGTAVGKQFGSAISWSYLLKVPVGSTTYDINFDDWMFLGPNGMLINRAVMKKFGFRVGELVLTFEKQA